MKKLLPTTFIFFVGTIFFAIGLFVVFGTSSDILDRLSVALDSEEITGTIVGCNVEIGSGGRTGSSSTHYYPVIEFYVEDDKYTFKGQRSLHDDEFRNACKEYNFDELDEPLQVQVLYKTDYPERAYMKFTATEWLSTLGLASCFGGFFLLFGGLLLLIGIVAVFRSKK